MAAAKRPQAHRHVMVNSAGSHGKTCRCSGNVAPIPEAGERKPLEQNEIL
jgi:hypothetical protein